MLFKLSFLVRRLAKEEGILPLFLICFGYSAPSVWSLKRRVNAEWKSICSVWLLCRPVLNQAANETHILTVSGTRCPEFIWWVQPQQRCQLNLFRLCVTTIVNKDYQLKSVKVTLYSHRHSLTPSKWQRRIHMHWFGQHLRYVRSVVSFMDTSLKVHCKRLQTLPAIFSQLYTYYISSLL
jgi:hypothetical protein